MRKSKMKSKNRWKKEQKGLGFFLNRSKEPKLEEIPVRREVYADKKDIKKVRVSNANRDSKT